MNMTRTVKKITTIWLLILFIGYAGSTTLFYHTHRINGRWITHSHPYSDAPDTGNHTHTSAGFVTITSLNAWLILAFLPGAFCKPFTRLSGIIVSPTIHKGITRETTSLSLRGPPHC
ncbi:hypothetical protein [Tannerella forsythia]|jgi:hypothetical protein|nr:hypothetical protein [Tannerella forsythia]KKY62708.1 hypothetical protein Tanf_00235 [Tannerella forsythia]OLQ20510.1 hypothetical protein BGK60_09785 [Tannerella forsythia]TPE16479.1 hypothetical protein FJN16_09610 [Tannerella forsythia]